MYQLMPNELLLNLLYLILISFQNLCFVDTFGWFYLVDFVLCFTEILLLYIFLFILHLASSSDEIRKLILGHLPTQQSFAVDEKSIPY